MSHRRRMHGFTLIEVLVALVIVALGMGALLAAITSSADAAGYLRDKTFAEWVGLNRLAEVRLRNQQVTAKSEGDVEMAGRRWHWEQEGTELEITPGLVRVDVRVRLADVAQRDEDTWITTVSGIVGDKIAHPGQINIDWKGQSPNPRDPNGPQKGSDPSAPTPPQPVPTPVPDSTAPTPVPSGAESQ